MVGINKLGMCWEELCWAIDVKYGLREVVSTSANNNSSAFMSHFGSLWRASAAVLNLYYAMHALRANRPLAKMHDWAPKKQGFANFKNESTAEGSHDDRS